MKEKEKILKDIRKKGSFIYRGTTDTRIKVNLQSETTKAKRKSHHIHKVLKKTNKSNANKNTITIDFYTQPISPKFSNEGEIMLYHTNKNEENPLLAKLWH